MRLDGCCMLPAASLTDSEDEQPQQPLRAPARARRGGRHDNTTDAELQRHRTATRAGCAAMRAEQRPRRETDEAEVALDASLPSAESVSLLSLVQLVVRRGAPPESDSSSRVVLLLSQEPPASIDCTAPCVCVLMPAVALRWRRRLRCLLLPLLLLSLCVGRCCLPVSAAERGVSPSPPARSWDEGAVQAWLSAAGLSEYAGVFQREAIDGEALLELTQDELTGVLGVSKLGHRKRIEKEIARLQQPAASAAEPLSSAAAAARPPSLAPSTAPASSRPAAAAARPLPPAPAAAEFEAAAAASQAKKRKKRQRQQQRPSGGAATQRPRTTADPASRHPLAERSSSQHESGHCCPSLGLSADGLLSSLLPCCPLLLRDGPLD